MKDDYQTRDLKQKKTHTKARPKRKPPAELDDEETRVIEASKVLKPLAPCTCPRCGRGMTPRRVPGSDNTCRCMLCGRTFSTT